LQAAPNQIFDLYTYGEIVGIKMIDQWYGEQLGLKDFKSDATRTCNLLLCMHKREPKMLWCLQNPYKLPQAFYKVTWD